MTGLAHQVHTATLGADDSAAAAAIHGRSFDQGWSACAISALLEDGMVQGFGLRDDAGTLLAFCLVRLVAGEADILTLATAPGARRRGLGGVLLRTAAQQLAALGAERMTLDVACDNTAALALYHRLGFAQDGRRKGYYLRRDGQRADALLLSAGLDRITGHSPGDTASTDHDSN